MKAAASLREERIRRRPPCIMMRTPCMSWMCPIWLPRFWVIMMRAARCRRFKRTMAKEAMLG